MSALHMRGAGVRHRRDRGPKRTRGSVAQCYAPGWPVAIGHAGPVHSRWSAFPGGCVAIPDPAHSMRHTVRVRTLNAILERAVPALERPRLVLPSVESRPAAIDVVRRSDLSWRESLLVTTKNSTYAINRAGEDTW